jgi:hypothetical protein
LFSSVLRSAIAVHERLKDLAEHLQLQGGRFFVIDGFFSSQPLNKGTGFASVHKGFGFWGFLKVIHPLHVEVYNVSEKTAGRHVGADIVWGSVRQGMQRIEPHEVHSETVCGPVDDLAKIREIAYAPIVSRSHSIQGYGYSGYAAVAFQSFRKVSRGRADPPATGKLTIISIESDFHDHCVDSFGKRRGERDRKSHSTLVVAWKRCDLRRVVRKGPHVTPGILGANDHRVYLAGRAVPLQWRVDCETK